jgi:hypothetical protein
MKHKFRYKMRIRKLTRFQATLKIYGPASERIISSHPNVDISFAKLDLGRSWICFLYFGRRRIVFLDYIPI